MKYYTNTGELVEYTYDTPKFWGTSAEIFSITKTLYLKKYYQETNASARMDLETFKILKMLNHPFMNRIVHLLYLQEKIKDKQAFLEHINEYQIDAYLYEFLPSKTRDFLKEKKEYIFYNMEALEELIVFLFSEEKLLADDLKKENTVFWGDKIVFIDLDNCKYCEKEIPEWIKEKNKEKLAKLFKNLVMRSKNYLPIYDDKVNHLFAIDTEESLLVQVERKLKRAKNIDSYLKNRET